MNYIRNSNGRVIGWTETVHSGVQQIRNANGKLLGWYDPTSDRTVDARTGNWMGIGNQLMILLGCQS